MAKNATVLLPNLTDYRQNLSSKRGIETPLKTVSFSSNGLLRELPPPPKEQIGWPWTIETKPLTATTPEGIPWPKISIVTPSYNQGSFIEETIRSVLLQNYPNLEYIICDGGSSDNTKEILEKYSSWLSFWQSERDRGQGHAINLGYSLASGNYFGWINSDDFYMPNCLQMIATNFLKVRRNFIYGDSLILHEGDKTISYAQNPLVLDRYLHFGAIIASHAAFWNSKIHKPIWEELNCAVDAELWLRLVPKQSRIHLNFPLAVSRVQPEAKSVNECYQKLWKQDYQEKIWKAYNHVNLWKLRCYEFKYFQSIYKKIRKPMSKQSIQSLIQRDELTLV